MYVIERPQRQAFVVLKPEFRGKIEAGEILSWTKERISSYKVPRYVDFIDALPMSGLGKVLRRVLLEEELNNGKAGAFS